jgi:hypothetical protein
MKSQVVGSKSSIKRAQSYHLTFMPLASIIELLADKFQVTGDIEQILGIRMKFFKYALLTYPQFQIYNKACQKTKANKILQLQQKHKSSPNKKWAQESNL